MGKLKTAQKKTVCPKAVLWYNERRGAKERKGQFTCLIVLDEAPGSEEMTLRQNIAFLFSGQGAQYPGMMRELYDEIPACKELFDLADKQLGRSISALCFEGTQEELNLTRNTQPCVLAADLAAYRALCSYGIRPKAVAGFSLGEYAALCAADVITVEDAFRLIQVRADAMQDAVPAGKGGMAAVMGLGEDAVKALCGRLSAYAAPANYNCPGQIVVSGEMGAIDELLVIAKSERIKAVKLPVSAPFHCRLMEPAAAAIGEALRGIRIQDPAFPVYMNVDACPLPSGEELAEKLLAQASSPVKWEQSLRNMTDIDVFVELGPGKTLSSFVKKTLSDAAVFRVENRETLEICLREIGRAMP